MPDGALVRATQLEEAARAASAAQTEAEQAADALRAGLDAASQAAREAEERSAVAAARADEQAGAARRAQEEEARRREQWEAARRSVLERGAAAAEGAAAAAIASLEADLQERGEALEQLTRQMEQAARGEGSGVPGVAAAVSAMYHASCMARCACPPEQPRRAGPPTGGPALR